MKVYAFLAEGFETVEALGVIDLLRRAKVPVTTVSVTGDLKVTSSHQIPVLADFLFEDVDFEDGSMLFLPGGVPGTPNLRAHKGLEALIKKYHKEQKYLAAICAAPSILGNYGVLDGKKATCYPGYEEELGAGTYTGAGVEVDGLVITGKGMGKTTDLGLALLEIIEGPETAERIKKAIQY